MVKNTPPGVECLDHRPSGWIDILKSMFCKVTLSKVKLYNIGFLALLSDGSMLEFSWEDPK